MDFTSDVTIIGSGPAGLQAAIHASRRKANVILIGKLTESALWKADIENYFGIQSATGEDLLNISLEQAKSFGTVFLEEEVTSLEKKDTGFVVNTDNGKSILSKSVVLAVGVSRKKLGVPGEKEFFGKGVSYCASCDAGFYKNKIVGVVGDGSEAGESAVLLSKYASNVYWISSGRSVSQYMLDKVNQASINLIDADVIEIIGENRVAGVKLDNGAGINMDGVFIALGAKGSMELALDLDIMPDIDGRIPVDADCKTSLDGVYACGDVTGKPYQVARAVGQGCIAGDNAAKFAMR
ncbi:thioredoxin reductase [Candidatus Methanomassiliicoccus intestinalis]|uniref:Thioredoxin reductase n=1 Tax=Methanomassiliicoccus intestinalis (strain Issoire-Mx1) TaxID=1295009 RepID=R9TC60_METII|nr:FAD-dependent oxidoreductase [Candidatus Methanomassiliicoccus intestinalis]AGN27043.1 Thioredoxin reductase [Candidatus Methanomassiliicoccus intestinalis Issoire-Mx1]TQS80982.1 MAG: thioredoxin reductase [Candidatus Methanomassiliicoccus intestinalis]